MSERRRGLFSGAKCDRLNPLLVAVIRIAQVNSCRLQPPSKKLQAHETCPQENQYFLEYFYCAGIFLFGLHERVKVFSSSKKESEPWCRCFRAPSLVFWQRWRPTPAAVCAFGGVGDCGFENWVQDTHGWMKTWTKPAVSLLIWAHSQVCL